MRCTAWIPAKRYIFHPMKNKSLKYKYDIGEQTDADGNKVLAYGYKDAMHSAVYLDPKKKYELVFPYNRSFVQAADLKEGKGRVLVIGGGMYTLPSYLIRFYSGLFVDVLEPDETTVPLAEKYFGLKELYKEIPDAKERLKIIPAYGREYLENCLDRYDIIINDAFSGSEPVYDLMSKEAAQLFKKALKPDGIYAANMLGHTDIFRSDLLLDEMRTLLEAFAYATADQAADARSKTYCNYILFASDTDYFQDPDTEELMKGTQVIEDRDLPHLPDFYEILSFTKSFE